MLVQNAFWNKVHCSFLSSKEWWGQKGLFVLPQRDFLSNLTKTGAEVPHTKRKRTAHKSCWGFARLVDATCQWAVLFGDDWDFVVVWVDNANFSWGVWDWFHAPVVTYPTCNACVYERLRQFLAMRTATLTHMRAASTYLWQDYWSIRTDYANQSNTTLERPLVLLNRPPIDTARSRTISPPTASFCSSKLRSEDLPVKPVFE